MNKINTKGFTLIELLVVIAIIGILSTIAMTSLSGARKKANDAAFKSAVSGALPGLTMCCDSGGTPTTADGAEICSIAMGAYYPASTKADVTAASCDATVGFNVAFTPPTGGNCTGSTSCTANGCTFAGCP